MRSLLLVVLLAPALGLAAKPKVVLDAPKQIGPAIEKALKAKYAISKASLSSEPTGGDVKAACRAAGGAIAVVTARQGGGDLFTVMVLNGADGAPLATFRVKGGKKPVKALPKPNVKALMEGLGDAKAPGKEKKEEDPKPPPEEAKPPPEEKKDPPPEEKPAVAEKKTERAKPTEPPPPPKEEVRRDEDERPAAKQDKPMALRLGVGLRLFNRRFGYRDDLFDALSTYYLPLGPAIGADLELYPAAFLTSGFAANFGLYGAFDYAVGIASRAEDGTRYGTTAINLKTGLIIRIPISILTIQPSFGFSRQVYSISSSTGVKPNIPSVGYNALRPALDLRVKIIGPVSFTIGAAYLAVLQTGEIGAFFPQSKAAGLDANAGFAVGLFDRLELRARFEYLRYWFTLNPEPGDMNVAGGALDHFVGGSVNIAFTL
ncbi:MAG: hypothetical protein JNK82_31450 [Myxococcaceae bacterium]|nr:hypothetical protein [Myxococcaceae bacterium]